MLLDVIHSKQKIFFVICLKQPNTVNQIHKEARGLGCLTKGPLTHHKPSPKALASQTDSIRG